jgi:hypothetical protein
LLFSYQRSIEKNTNLSVIINVEHKLVLHELELGAYASELELELELRAYRKQMFRFEIYANTSN